MDRFLKIRSEVSLIKRIAGEGRTDGADPGRSLAEEGGSIVEICDRILTQL